MWKVYRPMDGQMDRRTNGWTTGDKKSSFEPSVQVSSKIILWWQMSLYNIQNLLPNFEMHAFIKTGS